MTVPVYASEGTVDREQRGQEREAVAHDPPREENAGYRGEGHQHRVHRLHGGVRLGQASKSAYAGLIRSGYTTL